MTERLDSSRLIALGTDVSEGRAVDWGTAQREAIDEETRALLSNLQRVAAVVNAHRSETTDPAVPLEPATQGASHWRHLVLLEPVGEGAFGTVYRGWDTQLDREVAVKLLTRERADGREPLHEARHLARIRHSNVVTVYGAEQDEQQVGIWMEFIQGDTLSALLAERGPMSAREVAGIGIDLCRALSAIHGAGMLHGDIKAHNVMRERGGRIVLMDFSGVQALEREGGQGVVSGTPLYMAPELFNERPPTVASDIYSLGVLLFFLLSARHPVEGLSLQDLKTAHRQGVRTRLRDLRPELPESIVQIVERALAADAKARYRTAGEFGHALGTTSDSLLFPAGADVPAPASTKTRVRRIGLWLASAAAAGALVALATVWMRDTPPEESLLVRLTIGPPYNTASWPRVSPDGRMVLFGAEGDAGNDVVWMHPLDSVNGRVFLDGGARETPFWSADSQYVGFFEGGKLKKISITPGARPEALADVVQPRGADWNQDGTIIFATDAGIQRINADGTAQAAATTIDAALGENRHAWPEFLPDGRRFLYVVRSSRPEQNGVYLGSLEAPRRIRIMPAYSRTVYSRSGHLLFVRDGTLMAQRFDDRTEELLGEPLPVATNLTFHGGGDAGFDVSDNGVLVYRPWTGLSSMRPMLFDRRGRPLQEVAPTGFYRHPRFSPDGRRVALEQMEPGSTSPDIWLFDLVRGSAYRFTNHPAPDIRPAWSADGRRLAFSSRRGSKYDIYVKAVDTTEPEELVDGSEGDKFVEDWVPNSQSLITSVLRSGLWIRPLASAGKPLLIRASRTADYWQASVAPDGRRIAYVSADSGREEVYVEPLPGTGERWQASTQGGADPHWGRNGRELVYLAPDGSVMSVELSAGPRWQASRPFYLFRVSVPELFGTSDLTISGDSQHFVVNTMVGDPPVPPLQVVVNWTGLLGR